MYIYDNCINKLLKKVKIINKWSTLIPIFRLFSFSGKFQHEYLDLFLQIYL